MWGAPRAWTSAHRRPLRRRESLKGGYAVSGEAAARVYASSSAPRTIHRPVRPSAPHGSKRVVVTGSSQFSPATAIARRGAARNRMSTGPCKRTPAIVLIPCPSPTGRATYGRAYGSATAPQEKGEIRRRSVSPVPCAQSTTWGSPTPSQPSSACIEHPSAPRREDSFEPQWRSQGL